MLTIKNRPSEYRAIQMLQEADCITEGVTPLVEIVQEDVAYDKKTDPDTGAPVKEPVEIKSGPNKGKTRLKTVKDPDKARDVTLEKICEAFPNKLVLVDYFRRDITAYKDADPRKSPLVIQLANQLETYKTKVRQIIDYGFLVPVISICSQLDDNLTSHELAAFASELRELRPGGPIAIRIDDFDGYEDALEEALTPNDYLIYDINETPLASCEEEIDELNDLDIGACKILLCSPRRREVTNGKYAEGSFVDNGHIISFSEYGFDGVGDYAGLRDSLPPRGGGGIGCALAFLYDGRANRFRPFVNDNVNLGVRGYEHVVRAILDNRDKLEQVEGECIVLQRIAAEAQEARYGSWQTWITYTVVRYVQQLHITYGDDYSF